MPTGFPVIIDPEAWTKIEDLLTRKGQPGEALRIGVKGGGCSGLEYVFKLDKELRPNDLVIQNGNATVICDPKSAEFLQGSNLIYTGNLMGGGFAFENPNAVRSCGCGTSFTPKPKQA